MENTKCLKDTNVVGIGEWRIRNCKLQIANCRGRFFGSIGIYAGVERILNHRYTLMGVVLGGGTRKARKGRKPRKWVAKEQGNGEAGVGDLLIMRDEWQCGYYSTYVLF